MGSTKKKTQNAANESKMSESARMTIIVAIIGLIGTLGAAYLNYLSSRRPLESTTPTPLSSIAPTQAQIVTETPIAVSTISVTSTASSTPVSPEIFGGLTSDCIPDQYWDASDTVGNPITSNVKGCLQVSARGLHAADQKLLIVLNPQDVRESFSQTLFLPISGNVEISFHIILEDLKSGSDSKTDPLFAIGVCNSDKVRTAHNFIAYSHPIPQQWFWGILNDDLTNFKWKDVYTPNTSQSFLIKIDSFDLSIEDTETGNYVWKNPKVSPSDLKAFCIRYQLPSLGTLKASIEDFSVVKR